MLLGDPRGNQNNNLTDVDSDVGETGRRDGRRGRGGTGQAVGVETHAAGHISFVEGVIRIVQRCADKRPNQDAKADRAHRLPAALIGVPAQTNHGSPAETQDNPLERFENRLRLAHLERAGCFHRELGYDAVVDDHGVAFRASA